MGWSVHIRTATNDISDEEIVTAANSIREGLLGKTEQFGSAIVEAKRSLAELPDGRYDVDLSDESVSVRPYVEPAAEVGPEGSDESGTVDEAEPAPES